MADGKFFFAGRIYTINRDSEDVMDPSGHIVGNLRDVVSDMADPVKDRKEQSSSSQGETKRSTRFAPKSNFNARISSIRSSIKTMSITNRSW